MLGEQSIYFIMEIKMDTRTMNEGKSTKNENTSESFNGVYANDHESLREDIRSGFLADVFHVATIDTIYFEGNNLAALSCEDLKLFISLFEKSNVRTLYLGNNGL